MTEAATCPRCRGIGQKVKRVTYRPSGTISSIVYDPKADCEPCQGSGFSVVEGRKPCS